MNDATSPWPERRRTQGLLLGAGGTLLLVVALALAEVIVLSQTAIVGTATVASGLSIYGLLGWAGTWVEAGVEDDAIGGGRDVGGEDGDDEGVDGEGLDGDDAAPAG